jgi:phosphoribosylglycinamide formyltransferase
LRDGSNPSHLGTNLQALIDAQNTASLPHTEIVLVFSNRKAAFGLTRAAQAQPPIPTNYLALQPYLKAHPGKTRDDYDAEVARLLLADDVRPDLIVLAGWMHVFGDAFLERATQAKGGKGVPVINLHPALPGAFDGTNSIERAYEAFQKGEIAHSGVMVHRVVRDVDRGEPLVVREVPLTKGEALEVFAERLHKVEWEIIVQAAKQVLDEVVPISVSFFACFLMHYSLTSVQS